MPLKRKQGDDQRQTRNANAYVHVNLESFNKRLARHELLQRWKPKQRERIPVKLRQLLLGKTVLEAVLDLGDEDYNADCYADTSAKDAHLRNDALSNGFLTLQISTMHVNMWQCFICTTYRDLRIQIAKLRETSYLIS